MVFVLDVRMITKRYNGAGGISALTLGVSAGEIMGLVGSNGSGKSTSLRVICGLMEPDSGEVFISASDLKAQPLRAKASLGYVPDSNDLPELATCTEYFELVGALHGVETKQAISQAQSIMSLLQADEYMGHYIGALSHGTKKKVQIAGALISRPRLLVLDEPTIGLDAEAQAIFKELLKFCKGRGMAILMATHNLLAAEQICDSVTIIDHSESLFSGTLERLLPNGGRLEDTFLSMVRGDEWRNEVEETLRRLAL